MKAGYCAIAGEPNVGKSTLVNGLLGQKLSIVTPKPQTTRFRVPGILTMEGYQLVFLDCPGMIEPSYELQTVMMKRVEQVLGEADLIVLVVEATSTHGEREEEMLAHLRAYHKPLFLVINKIDRVRKPKLLPLIDAYQKAHSFNEVIPVSARTGDGLDILLDLLVRYLPEGDILYPPDQLSDHPERFFVSEIVREKIFLSFGKEIPYSTAVVVDEFTERAGKKDHIRAIVYVERDSQKSILIGKKGAALKKIGEEARRDIEELIGRQVFLELWVKVRKNWRKKARDIKEFGY